MKSALAIVVFGLSSYAAAAAWQESRGPQGPGGRGGMPPFMSPLVAALDLNRDGTLSADEIDKASVSLKALDRNGDGRVEFAELMPMGRRGPGGPGGPGGRGPEGRPGRGPGGGAAEPGETPAPSADDMVAMLMAFDANKDGVLEKGEVPERLQPLFDRADANKDGKLSADEIRASASAVSQPNRMGGRGEGREGGRGEGGRDGRGPEGRGPGRGMDPLMNALDVNHDGVLDAAELASAPASLRTLDKNKDGQLTPDEYRPARREN